MDKVNSKLVKDPTLAAFQGGGGAFKALTAAFLTGCISFGLQPDAVAAESSQTSTNKSYTLVQVENESENTITSYEYDPDTQTITPDYYEVKLNETEYTYGNGANTLNYNTGALSDAINVTVKYDTSSNRIEKWGQEPITEIKDTVFVNQYKVDNNWVGGGAVLVGDSAKLDSIENSGFAGNYTEGVWYQSSSDYSQGGAILNQGEIGDISGYFVGNSTTASMPTSYGPPIGLAGGAIYNSGTITTLAADFVANGMKTEIRGSQQGGAIYNFGTIGEIKGDFVGNYLSHKNANNAPNDGSYFTGGAIYNETYDGTLAKIGNITGNFIGNYIDGTDCTLGGAIYNGMNMETGDITGDFIGNHLSGTGYALGAAIYNDGKMGKIKGDFVGNYIDSPNGQLGAAIFNGNKDGRTDHLPEIGDITGNFIGNYIKSDNGYGCGAAVFNSGKMGNITGDFIGNYLMAPNRSGARYGAAIYNSSKYSFESTNENIEIGNIKGNFVGNYIKNTTTANGAGIANNAKIGNIEGNFLHNTIECESNAAGAAISNGVLGLNSANAKIGNITGNFVENSIKAHQGYGSYGAAIYNQGTIFDVKGDFIRNTIDNTTGTASGAAIANGIFAGEASRGNQNVFIGNITGDFIENHVAGVSFVGGTAIQNNGKIGDIKGNFTGNYAQAHSSSWGGAIFNNGKINSITGNFVNNALKNSSESQGLGSDGFGGAILNNDGSSIGDIKGDFIGNYIEGSMLLWGGAINNRLGASIQNITGNFINNHLKGSGSQLFGGAIINSEQATIENITGDFIGNYVEGDSYLWGGAIYNKRNASIKNITGNFVNNYIKAESAVVDYGGAICNEGTIGDIKGDFIGNYIDIVAGDEHTSISGGALDNREDATIGNITGNFVNNHIKCNEGYISTTQGGAIYARGTLGNIKGNFIGNYIERTGKSRWSSEEDYNLDYAVQGGAIAFQSNSEVSILGDFKDNYILSTSFAQGGALCIDSAGSQTSHIKELSGVYSGNHATSEKSFVDGGALAIINGSTVDVIKNSSFINNYAESKEKNARGAAIFSSTDLNIVADNYNSLFSGNYTISKGVKEQNAIYLTNKYIKEKVNEISNVESNTITLTAKNNATIQFDDEIYNEVQQGSQYKVLEKPNTALVKKEYLNNEKVYNNVNLTGDMSSKIIINNNIKNGHVRISDTNVYSPTPAPFLQNPDVTVDSGILNFARFNNEVYNFNNFSNKSVINVGSVDVDVAGETMGRLTANEYGDMSGEFNVHNLNYLSTPVKDVTTVLFADKEYAQNVNYLGQDYVYSPIFKYDVSYLPGSGEFLFARSSGKNASDSYNPAILSAPVSSVAATQSTVNETFKYVFEHADAFTQLPQIERLSHIEANKYAISTDYNSNLGSFNYDEQNKAAWVRPYTTFESMDLRHGPKVDAITYGTLIGYDGDFKEMKHGWHRIGTSYIGYNGSQLSYSGNDTTMNGGLLGMTETFYKGNFWTALTASAGASVGETTTMYGKEDFTSLLAGIGSKTGYNFEFKEGKLIVQPIMFMSYTFVNTFDYTNAAGVSIDTKPAHSIQLNPSIRIISNLKNGWQPYASVGMVWNLMNESNVTANGVKLPEMSMKPYVEYGLGVQRNWKDKFTAFGQAMVRNGGRNGVALTAGFRWAIGRDPEKDHNHEQVYRPAKKVVKKASL